MRAALLALVLLSSRAPEYVVSPDGKPDNAGTKESPWDLATALSGAKKIEPGATVWVRGGTYTGRFQVKLAGTENAPIQVRAAAGQRVTILNCGIDVAPGTDYVWHLAALWLYECVRQRSGGEARH